MLLVVFLLSLIGISKRGIQGQARNDVCCPKTSIELNSALSITFIPGLTRTTK